MGVSTIPDTGGGSSGGAIGWTLIQAYVTDNTVGTYTFSSLSGYKMYKFIHYGDQNSANAIRYIRLNGVSTSAYSTYGTQLNTATWAGKGILTTGISTNASDANTGTYTGTVIIDNALSSDMKDFVYTRDIDGTLLGSMTLNGVIHSSITAITSLTYAIASGTLLNGRIALYGGN